jgi:hypothetical protein
VTIHRSLVLPRDNRGAEQTTKRLMEVLYEILRELALEQLQDALDGRPPALSAIRKSFARGILDSLDSKDMRRHQRVGYPNVRIGELYDILLASNRDAS